jgi:hypothetical protein
MTKPKTPSNLAPTPVVNAASAPANAETGHAQEASVANASKDKNGNKVPAIRVVSRPDNFRRAGIAFSSSPVDLKLSDLTEEQIAAIRGERNLVVLDCEVEA